MDGRKIYAGTPVILYSVRCPILRVLCIAEATTRQVPDRLTRKAVNWLPKEQRYVSLVRQFKLVSVAHWHSAR